MNAVPWALRVFCSTNGEFAIRAPRQRTRKNKKNRERQCALSSERRRCSPRSRCAVSRTGPQSHPDAGRIVWTAATAQGQGGSVAASSGAMASNTPAARSQAQIVGPASHMASRRGAAQAEPSGPGSVQGTGAAPASSAAGECSMAIPTNHFLVGRRAQLARDPMSVAQSKAAAMSKVPAQACGRPACARCAAATERSRSVGALPFAAERRRLSRPRGVHNPYAPGPWFEQVHDFGLLAAGFRLAL